MIFGDVQIVPNYTIYIIILYSHDIVHNQKNRKVSLNLLLLYGTGSTITIIRIEIWLD